RWGDDQDTFILPAYACLDAFAKYQFVAAGARWSAQINVNNIANTKYYPGSDNFYNFVTSPRFNILAGAPRSIIASLRVEY
ncbi:MAG: TonB-dependent siderophore receptor, partial [Candidatus Binataceae bacterium]